MIVHQIKYKDAEGKPQKVQTTDYRKALTAVEHAQKSDPRARIVNVDTRR